MTIIVVVVVLMVMIFENVGFSDTPMSTAPLATFIASGHDLNVQGGLCSCIERD